VKRQADFAGTRSTPAPTSESERVCSGLPDRS
jgi:hypothetical protein